ncbi:MAG: recombinase family protein [Actinomycetota bacterium]|nr:recombinase family protein [Actinomycetota bacterium]
MVAGRPVRAAAIYARISQDREGLQLGVQRQKEDCAALAATKGWSIARVYVDDDVSAWDQGKTRAAYRQMLHEIAAGMIDGVVVWDLDRLHRQPRELEHFFDVCAGAGLTHFASVSGDVDLGTEEGRFHARILGAVAAKESADKSRRLRRQREQAARRGLPMGGRRPYGYEPNGMDIRAQEAERVREAAWRALRGESIRSIAMRWNNEGVWSSTGRLWTVQSLKGLLSGTRIAGLRLHHGEVIGPAAWPAIIDRETHQRLRAVLVDPRQSQRGRPPRNLLTGMCRCGRCKATLLSSRAYDGARRYMCHTGPGSSSGCGRLAVRAVPLEGYLAESVLTVLDGPGLQAAVEAAAGEHFVSGGLVRQLKEDENALEQLEGPLR